MQALHELLPIRKVNLTPKVLDEKTIFFVCKQVLIEEYGVRGAENLIPTYFKERKLFLSPKTSLWASEAHMRRKHLVERINNLLGTPALAEVKISQHY